MTRDLNDDIDRIERIPIGWRLAIDVAGPLATGYLLLTITHNATIAIGAFAGGIAMGTFAEIGVWLTKHGYLDEDNEHGDT